MFITATFCGFLPYLGDFAGVFSPDFLRFSIGDLVTSGDFPESAVVARLGLIPPPPVIVENILKLVFCAPVSTLHYSKITTPPAYSSFPW